MGAWMGRNDKKKASDGRFASAGHVVPKIKHKKIFHKEELNIIHILSLTTYTQKRLVYEVLFEQDGLNKPYCLIFNPNVAERKM